MNREELIKHITEDKEYLEKKNYAEVVEAFTKKIRVPPDSIDMSDYIYYNWGTFPTIYKLYKCTLDGESFYAGYVYCNGDPAAHVRQLIKTPKWYNKNKTKTILIKRPADIIITTIPEGFKCLES